MKKGEEATLWKLLSGDILPISTPTKIELMHEFNYEFPRYNHFF